MLVLEGRSPIPETADGVQSVPLPVVESLANRTWRLRAPQPEAVYDSGLVTLPNRDVLVIGGVDDQERAVQQVFLYDPTADRWSRMPDLPAPRAAPFATLLEDGTVLVGGGASDSPSLFPPPSGLSTALIFDPATEAWRSISSTHAGRLFASATRLPDGTVLVAGGDDQGSPLASAEIFDPAMKAWTMAASLPHAREQHLATLAGGKVILVGGSSFNRFGGGFAATPGLDAEIFDVRSRSWSLGSPPGVNLHIPIFVAAAPIATQRILALSAPPQPALAYDAGSDYWSRITRPPAWQGNPTLRALADGQALLLAGKSAWLFDANSTPRSGDTGPGKETVILFLIAGVLLFLIGVQRLFRGRRLAPG
jgi:Kelch motif protein